MERKVMEIMCLREEAKVDQCDCDYTDIERAVMAWFLVEEPWLDQHEGRHTDLQRIIKDGVVNWRGTV